jgi:hypothetical protein
MTYTPYLIANYSTGVETRLQPWLIPDDAQEQLFDGTVYRGTMSKREGYNYFATGEKGGSVYRESRIVSGTPVFTVVGLINGVNATYTVTGGTIISPGSVVMVGSNPNQIAVDDGIGGFTGAGTGTINYATGDISVTFTNPPLTGSSVVVHYSFGNTEPVMMVANFITATNIKELIVASTLYINRYNPSTNILEDITVTPYTGNKYQFFTWVNYASAASVPRLLFTNNKDVIQQYDGTTVTDYVYSMLSTDAIPVPVTTLTCSWMADFKDRLILLRTTENGTIYAKRIRISGTGQNSDDFRTSATGAGFIDIPDGTWIQGAAFNRDDLIIFTEASTWVLKYTGNDTKPFVLNKIDESRGSDATFGVITYLNRTSAVSKRGLIISDGYRVERQDLNIPDFTFNEVDGRPDPTSIFNNFNLCFAGTVDDDRDHYLIYPPSGSDTSKRILTTNYDEDNYSVYRLPLSCMGTYLTAFTITWDDLIIYPNWASFATAYGDWNSLSYNAGEPFSVGGGQNGEIWRLSVTETEDNPVRIYNIKVINGATIEVTTDFNNYRLNEDNNPTSDPDLKADYIFLSAIVGMEEINNHQFPIVEIVNPNVFRLDVSTIGFSALTLSAYTSGGTAQRVIPFSALFKKFNPYIDQDRKVRCGWLYMYVDSTGTDLQRNIAIGNITTSNPAIVTTIVDHNLESGDQVNFFKVGGMVELNGTYAFITVIDPLTFSLNGVDSSMFTNYTTGGYVAVDVPAKMTIDIITNDVGHKTQLQNLSQNPYQGNMTNMTFEDGNKKWYKVFINQVGKFIQFRLRNEQSGAKVNIQATMPGFQPVGRLI